MIGTDAACFQVCVVVLSVFLTTSLAATASAQMTATLQGELTGADATEEDGYRYDEYSLSCTVGQAVTIRVDSKSFDTYAELEVGGMLWTNDDRSDSDRNSTIVATPRRARPCLLSVSSYEPGATGSYTIEIDGALFANDASASDEALASDEVSTTTDVLAPTNSAATGDVAGHGLPTRVDIDFVGVVVSPMRIDGVLWDGNGRANTDDLSTFLRVVQVVGAGNPYVSVAAELGSLLRDGPDGAQPDVFGYTRALVHGEWAGRMSLSSPGNNQDDTISPSFSGPPGYRGLLLTPDTRVQVTLHDEDGDSHENISVVEVTSRHIEAALASEGVYAIPMTDQSQGHVLYLRVSVRRSSSETLAASGELF